MRKYLRRELYFEFIYNSIVFIGLFVSWYIVNVSFCIRSFWCFILFQYRRSWAQIHMWIHEGTVRYASQFRIIRWKIKNNTATQRVNHARGETLLKEKWNSPCRWAEHFIQGDGGNQSEKRAWRIFFRIIGKGLLTSW